jgi:hypothetical protein
VLGQDEGRDQVAGDDEEDVDAEEAGGQPVGLGVVEDDRDDGERPEPVDPRLVPDTLLVPPSDRDGLRRPSPLSRTR